MWDAEDGQELFSINGHTAGVAIVAFSLDGTHILTGCIDGVVRLGRGGQPGSPCSQGAHRSGDSVGFSPDGTRVLTGSQDRTAKLWDAEGQELLVFKGHTRAVTSVAFQPDGKRIVTGSEDSTAKVWDAANGQELLTLKGHTQPVSGVAFSPDGKRIVTGSYGRDSESVGRRERPNSSLSRGTPSGDQRRLQPRRPTHRHRLL